MGVTLSFLLIFYMHLHWREAENFYPILSHTYKYKNNLKQFNNQHPSYLFEAYNLFYYSGCCAQGQRGDPGGCDCGVRLGKHASYRGYCQPCPRWCSCKMWAAQHRGPDHCNQRCQPCGTAPLHLPELHQGEANVISIWGWYPTWTWNCIFFYRFFMIMILSTDLRQTISVKTQLSVRHIIMFILPILWIGSFPWANLLGSLQYKKFSLFVFLICLLFKR